MTSHQKKIVPCKGCINDCTLVIVEDEYGVQVFGNHCRKGDAVGKEAYEKERADIFTGKVKVKGKWLPVRVRSSGPVDPGHHEKLRAHLATLQVEPPLEKGEILMADILQLGVDLLCDQTK